MSTVTSSPNQSPGRRLRVAGVDDQPVFRIGLAAALAEFEIVEIYGCTEDLLTAGPDVDVVVLDLHLRDASRQLRQGAAAVQAVASAGYRVLLYTSEMSPAKLVGCLRAGARGIRHKNETTAALADGVRAVAGGEFVVTAAVAGLAELLERHGGLPELTQRELVVLRGLARGKTYIQIASEEHLSDRSIAQQGGTALKKFATVLQARDARDLAELLGLSPGDLLDWDPSPKVQ
jgi:DNA-binding NarL/FixJ family response regulator